MKQTEPVIHSDPEIVGGTPVFVGTRVPLATLLDYLEASQPLSEFLEDFPTVTREQPVAAPPGGVPRPCASCLTSPLQPPSMAKWFRADDGD
jgi:uncharacterized protein (DUF433 family)